MLIYKIEGEDLSFRSLLIAKRHIGKMFTPEDRIKRLTGKHIIKYKNDKPVTSTPIIVTSEGYYSFSKTIKL